MRTGERKQSTRSIAVRALSGSAAEALTASNGKTEKTTRCGAASPSAGKRTAQYGYSVLPSVKKAPLAPGPGVSESE